MAKNSVRDFDATAANNTDIESVNIAEGCAPSGINNAIRELMADMKDVSAGTIALESPQADSMTVTGDLTVGDGHTIGDDANDNLVITSSANENIKIFSSKGFIEFGQDASNEWFRVDNLGNFGIGTTSPGYPLHVSGNGFGTIAKFSSDDGANNPRLLIYGSSSGMHIQRTSGSGAANLMFEVGGAEGGGTEAMRIDSSGNLLVGTTDTSPYNNNAGSSADNGIVLSAGRLWAARNSGSPLDINRTNDEGTIALFRKDGAERLKIGARSVNGGAIGFGTTGLEFNEPFDCIIPINTDTYALADNLLDLGVSSARFDDIFATNNVIQTSDANEKQQIAILTDAEIAAAKAISKLFKTYKWNDSVTKNGDNARTHAGVIAQDVQSAMTDAGLDAGDYAFYCSDTWWETQTDVPAVAAVAAQDAVLDDDGNIVTEAVEAVEARDAHTRTDIYKIADEAPEGATERTRLGIRYPELLAFIGAATEQRLADIETRLTALEA